MKMIQKAILVSALLIISASTVIASDKPEGNPFKEIWKAITNLQEQIKNIQLIPGPQGEKGETGLQGLQGLQGIQGPAGQPSWDEQRIATLEARVSELEQIVFPSPLPSSSPLPAVVIDSFNNYADGSIIGQGGWEEYANGNNFIIESISVYEGAKALYSNSTADNVIFKSGNAMADGRQAFYIKSENRASWGDYNPGNINIRVSKSAWGTGSIFTAVGFKKNGNVVYADQDGNYHDFATFNDNEWTLLEIEWRSSDNTARYRVNSGTWTSWVSFYGSNSFTNFDNVGVGFYLAGGTGGMYIDNLY